MDIGLIDVDSHNFPNLALMKISAYHKRVGDHVEFALPMQHYDIVEALRCRAHRDAGFRPDLQPPR